MSGLTTIARPYAKAAFGYASDNGTVDQWSSMLELAQSLSLAPELEKAALRLQPQQLMQLYFDVAGEYFDEPLQNFLKVIIENRRTSALSDIYQQFQLLSAESLNVKEVTITTSFELSEAQLAELVKSLEKHFDSSVKVNCLVDGSLIGGAVIRSGDTVLDNSLVSRINRLKDVIKS